MGKRQLHNQTSQTRAKRDPPKHMTTRHQQTDAHEGITKTKQKQQIR